VAGQRSIRLHLATLILGVALPLFALVVWGFWMELDHQRRSSQDLALRIAHSLAADVHAANVRSDVLLTRMAARPKIQAGNVADCDTLFPIVDFFPEYLNLELFDAGGSLLCSAEPEKADQPFARQAEHWVQAFLAAHPPMPGDPVLLPMGDHWISIALRPVPRSKGPTVLALVQYLDLNIDAYPPGTVVTVVDDEGRILVRTLDPSKWLGRSGTRRPPQQRHREGSAELPGIDGKIRQYGFTPVAGTHWRLFVGIPADVVTSPVRALFVKGMLLGLLVLLVLFLWSLRLSRAIERPLGVLAAAARRVEDTGYSAPVPASGPREIVYVGEAFNRMVARRAEADAALVESKNQLESLSKRLLEVQEEERTRIAREIHDDLGQRLTALKIDVGGLLQAVPPQKGLEAVIGRIRSALDETFKATHRLAAELRPPALDDFGFLAALESDIRAFEERTGIECELSLPSGPLPLAPEVETAAYRIVQEAMTNVARHANATRLEIRMRTRGNEMLVEVRDDGRGITGEDLRGRTGLGLVGMRERARQIGATVDVEGVDGKGTIVSLRIPLKGEE
jgi:signal transduction histidine kinase